MDQQLIKKYSHESIKELAEQHRELLAGIAASISGGATLDDIRGLINMASDQSEDLDNRILILNNIDI